MDNFNKFPLFYGSYKLDYTHGVASKKSRWANSQTCIKSDHSGARMHENDKIQAKNTNESENSSGFVLHSTLACTAHCSFTAVPAVGPSRSDTLGHF